MMNYPIVPYWFYGYNSFLEMIFFVVTLLVGAYAIHIYNLSGQKQSKLFGFSFLMVSSSYFIQSFLNFAASYSMSDGCSMQTMAAARGFNILGVYAHMILFLAILVTILYMTLRRKDAKMYGVMLTAVMLVLLLSSNKLYFFYVISSMLLIYISFYYLRNYLKNRKTNSLVVFIAFLFLLFV